MKVVSYSLGGTPAYGVVRGDGVVTVSHKLGKQYPSLGAILRAGALHRIATAAAGEAPDLKVKDLAFLPVVWDPEKVLLVGLNYEAHRIETGRDKTEHPSIFARFNSAQVGHNQPMLRPKVSERLDFEGELALVIGRRGRYIPRAEALDYVAGYSCYNDGSVRDWQRHTTQFTPGKNFPKTGGFGPFLVTPDEVGDVQKLNLETRLNGQVVQQTNTSDMTYTVAHCIEYISSFTELVPGDVISTGTPSGVGAARKPPLWMKAGDVVEVEIEKVGLLRNPIADE